jgi:hypothetical protein
MLRGWNLCERYGLGYETSYGQKWIERLAAGYFTNMWPENMLDRRPNLAYRDFCSAACPPFLFFILYFGMIIFNFAQHFCLVQLIIL